LLLFFRTWDLVQMMSFFFNISYFSILGWFLAFHREEMRKNPQIDEICKFIRED